MTGLEEDKTRLEVALAEATAEAAKSQEENRALVKRAQTADKELAKVKVNTQSDTSILLSCTFDFLSKSTYQLHPGYIRLHLFFRLSS